MSILGPVIFGSIMIVPAWLTQVEDTEVKRIAVLDSSKIFYRVIPETDYLKFDYLDNIRLQSLKQNYADMGYYAILYISHIVTFDPNSVIMYSHKQPSLSTKIYISNALEEYIKTEKLKTFEIHDLDNILKSIKTNINIRTIKLTDSGKEKESSTGLMMAVGYIAGFTIYVFIFLFGAMVMRGVIEEKTSRIVEVILSSVKPFQLMMGKIIGVGMVGLTQFIIWVISTLILVSIAKAVLFPELTMTPTEQITSSEIMSASPVSQIDDSINTEQLEEIRSVFAAIKNIDFVVMLGTFLFYFLGGYFLYSSLFASVGSAVDSETETQQFMLPVTVPLILGLLILINAINNPGNSISFWFSIIPFTSPIVMMARIPFGVPIWEFTLSAVLLILTFIGTVWMAGKIYKTGILLYGKKVTYKELWKWVRYSN